MIDVAGVTVPRAAIARLAQQMQRSEPMIAIHLGRAIDANLPKLMLHHRDAERILEELDANPLEELDPLRQALRSRPRERESMGALHVLPTPGASTPVTVEAAASV